MPRFLVLGANGQLGRDLCPSLPGDVSRGERPQVDLTNSESLRGAIASAKPDMVINCAAYNFVDKAESEPEAAFAVNALGVRNLARICAELNLTLLHFSTDYVFGLDAARRTPWSETDLPGPISAYGVSKLAGEQFVQAYCPRHIIIRSCGLYGAWGSGGKGGNFVETMLRLADQGKPIRVVTDEICTPTYCLDLAEAAVALLGTGRFGLYHITNGGECSRFEFAREIMRQAGKPVEVIPITSREFGAAARRPTYAVLAMDAYERLGLPPMRPWREALAAYLRERNERVRPMARPGS